jgi:hypothetical protein
MACSCEHGNEHSDAIKCGKFWLAEQILSLSRTLFHGISYSFTMPLCRMKQVQKCGYIYMTITSNIFKQMYEVNVGHTSYAEHTGKFT